MKTIVSKLSLYIIAILAFNQISSVRSECDNLAFFQNGITVQKVEENNFCRLNYGGTSYDYALCCGNDTPQKLHDWWYVKKMDPNDPNSLTPYEKRLEDLHNVAKYNVEIFALLNEINTAASGIIANLQAEKDCKESAEDILKPENKVYPRWITQFVDATSQCWEWKNDLILSYICAACDQNFDGHYDITEQKITASSKTVDQFLNMCWHTSMMLVYRQIPLYKNLSKLSICDKNGKKTNRFLYSNNDNNLAFAMQNCGNTYDSIQCAAVAAGGMNLLSPSPSVEGDPDYLRGIYWNLMELLGKPVTKTDREKQADAAKQSTDRQVNESKASNSSSNTSSSNSGTTAANASSSNSGTPAANASSSSGGSNASTGATTTSNRLLEENSERDLAAVNGINMYGTSLFVFKPDGYRITQFINTNSLKQISMTKVWTKELTNKANDISKNQK